MTQFAAMIHNWISDPDGALIRPVQGGGFSGARLWRVQYRERLFVLRQWPAKVPAGRLIGIHEMQRYLARRGLPVPAPIPTSATGQTCVEALGAQWELAPWMPGTADYHADPQPEKLEAAFRLLAQVHLATAGVPDDMPSWMAPVGISPALLRRSEKLCNLVLADARKLLQFAHSLPTSAGQPLAVEAMTLIERTAPTELQRSQRWESEPLARQMCLRDIWHDHVLFTANRVTGLIDFGAIGFDSIAGDVARLLGSMVGDDQPRWHIALASYEAIRPMSSVEREALDFFDSSGVVLSAVNWIRWLFRDPSTLPPTVDRTAAMQRLERLIGRLRVLAESK